MKKIPFIAIWFTFLGIVLFMTSCKSKTTLIENETTSEKYDFRDQVTGTNKIIDRSLAINDYFKMGVPYFITGSTDKNCDSLCNAQKEKWLEEQYTKKESGNNSYEFLYNKLTKQFELNVKIGETVNSYKDSLNSLRTEFKDYQKQVIRIPVKLPLTKVEKFFFFSGIGFWALLIILGLTKLYFKRKI